MKMGRRLLLCLFVVTGVTCLAQEKPRVFVTDSQSWEITGNAGGSQGAFGAHTQGGARPQTAEIVKTFGERCPQVVINNIREKADYVVVLDHEGGKGLLRKDNKVAVFNHDGDSIVSHSTRSLGNSVEDACTAIAADWPKHTSNTSPQAADSAPGTSAKVEQSGAKVAVSSTPTAADIEVDGAFVGNTPSSIELASGDHTIVVRKNGFQEWHRKIRVTGGDLKIVAELAGSGT